MSPGAKYAVIPGAAHLVEWDNPDETNRVILAFLKSVASAKTDAVTPNLTRP